MQEEICLGFIECSIFVFVYFKVVDIYNGACYVTEFAVNDK